MVEMCNTVLVTGYAKAPQGTTMANVHGYVGIVLLIDKDSDTIVAAEPTFLTGLAQSFISEILVGYDINRGDETLRSEIRRRYLAPSQQALVQAIQNAFQRYRERLRSEMEASTVHAASVHTASVKAPLPSGANAAAYATTSEAFRSA